ncbi:DNA polymerase III subunit beta [Enterobacteriaceae endosymbiont of Plateumaris braccata]|uniref:DNA polymerase III subunit beta n=1 Tax=Enterobacteriaceae endosymbiont of Plateumaris braccata TaxID=2675793 RepID=UPI00144A137D|nr:DNA polymerase III subunit beta [Enterobacteriaceae endosymbiont of Plateumaris braccata]QJC28389.1 DNA polymerase III subunit beta [Enterobacteriaceae endosymbiont of Plateumaris braccata]
MKYVIINREQLIIPLKKIVSIIHNRPIIPIINNILIEVKYNNICFKSTNLEIEIITFLKNLQNKYDFSITIAGKKFYDICKSFPINSNINISINDNNQVIISSEKCKFIMSTLPSINFPVIAYWESQLEFFLTNKILKVLIDATYFSIANQDIRQYLNGALFQIKNNILNMVSTDGHRLSICSIVINEAIINYSVIIPKKSIIELLRLLNNNNDIVKIKINNNNISFNLKNLKFTSKLIENSFPEYTKIIPQNFYKIIKINRILFKNSLIRISILVNKKTKGVTLLFNKKYLKILGSNIDNEQAEDLLSIEEEFNDIKSNIEISLNIEYLIDVLNTLKNKYIKISLIDSISSIKIEDIIENNKVYLIMPMRI